jgi:hypothetical protein
MSRHVIPALFPNVTVVIGWDNPLNTFFAQVTREQDDDDSHDPVVLWLGSRPGEVIAARDLVAPLMPYAVLSPEDIGQLDDDRAACGDGGPTVFQREMLTLLGRKP